MDETLFDENTFFGYQVNTRLFWVIFTLMMVFFTSPMAHLPFFFGFGPLACIVIGFGAVAFNVIIPVYVAHRSWKRQESAGNDKVLNFNASGKS